MLKDQCDRMPSSMKSLWIPFIALFIHSSHLSAEELGQSVDTGGNPTHSKLETSFETDVDYSYVGDARTNLGHGRTGELSEQSVGARFVVAPRWGEGPIYRFGLGFQRFSFGLPSLAPLPNTLQSATVIVGADLQVFNSWLVRIEAEPGIYSDFRDVSSSDFNVPFIIGGSYIAGADLQWILGLSVDVNRRYPVIPAIGVRWSFADRWVLDAVLPSPRLEYEWKKGWTLYAGADFKDGTYRVSNTFGNAHDDSHLNSAIVEYDEIRVGAGTSWKASKDFTLEVEGGYLPYREFDFHRAGTSFRNETGAAYGQMSISGRF
jgi:hypothetical protein